MKHICHWPGCKKEVPPAMWGCKPHWMKIPKYLRDGIWNTYLPGQEIKKNPSAAYLVAAKKVQDWIVGFEVGDKVRLRPDCGLKLEQEEMKLGKTYKVSEVHVTPRGRYVQIKGLYSSYQNDWLEKI